jgi:hypothetical protein
LVSHTDVEKSKLVVLPILIIFLIGEVQKDVGRLALALER